MMTVLRRGFVAMAAGCAIAFAWTTASIAQQRPKITVSSLTLPVFNPMVWNIMKARGFDAKHGFELESSPIRPSPPSTPAFSPARPTC